MTCVRKKSVWFMDF